VLEADTETGESRRLTDDPGVYDHLKMLPDRETLLCTHRSATNLPEVCLLSLKDGGRRRLTCASDTLNAFRLSETEALR
jgi:hypothetical protein